MRRCSTSPTRSTSTEYAVRVFEDWKHRRAQKRVKPGDGHPLKPYHWWQMFSRALFHLTLDDGNRSERWSVSVNLWGEGDDGEVRAHLYKNGAHSAQSKLPAIFEVTGGVIEVQISQYGLKRCHFVPANGKAQALTPDPASAEGKRAKLDRNHPVVSRMVGIVSVLILVVALVLGVPQLFETITSIPPVAARIGTFESPISLPAWFNTGLVIAAVLASVERALRLRYNWLLDGGLFEDED